MNQINSLNNDDIIFPTLFYREILLEHLNKESRKLSYLTLKTKKKPFLLKSIDKKSTNRFKKNELIKQIIPFFIIDYKIIQMMEKYSEGYNINTISEFLNKLTLQREIPAIKIESLGNFYDIDTITDLEYLNKKKSGQ
jgi:hypothetical protein